MRGHSQIFYLEMVGMAVGGWMFLDGDALSGLVVFGISAVIHFGMGGFATEFMG
jgi:hypothetical protein